MTRAHLRRIAWVAVLTLTAAGAAAQEPVFYSASSAHYRVLSDASQSFAHEVARKMEAVLGLCNEYLRFDPADLPLPLGVRIFASREEYERYLMGIIAETRSDFVFISYSDPGRSELVGFQREPEEFDSSLLHYGLIQLLNSRIPGAPLWLEEGMATYLEASRYDSGGNRFVLAANLTWLDSLKGILRDPELSARFSIEDLLRADRAAAQSNIEIFYPAAWGLVHFLLETPDRRFNRMLWDSLSALEPSAGVLDNSRRVQEKAFSWISPEELQRAVSSYILSLRTFNDLVRQAVSEYGRGELEGARTLFVEAREMRQDSYIPPYYLGLIAYQNRAYEQAAGYYLEAQRLGVDPALAQYALGVNAFAAGNYSQATEYLKRARELDPAAFGGKVDALLRRIEAMQ
ncbi:MAG: DUF1570 domain-containing protein [Spirochaetales bacterium]|nr:DUF1570 domain-containing protein [Spirochaetales bacterium]